MFTRVGSSAFKANLTNTIALCDKLDNPQHKFKSIHVGGTNGKGSTSHMLAAILQTAGYKTGLYTSPHLKDFRERIRINGQMISEQSVIDFVQAHLDDFEEIQPSFFEMTVGLAFDIFAKEKVDIAVIEVGLGGRLDSTNVITPLLSVITNIGWDHMNILGDTLHLIAAEKAGIIKPNIPVIIGEYQEEVAEVFIDKAKQEKTPILFASEELKAESLNPKASDNTIELAITHNSQLTTHNLRKPSLHLQHLPVQALLE
jgi:dihydrofolate synthase/folylpolyglutamate synthase